MDYKYKRWQIGKPLDVPKDIKLAIYECRLSFNDFIKYNLEDKIPISCLDKWEKEIVEMLGIEKAKQLDWDLINRNPILDGHYFENDYRYQNGFRVKDLLLDLLRINMYTINDIQNINEYFYERVYPYLKWKDYSEQMKDKYKNCFIDTMEVEDELIEKINRFNDANISIDEIIYNWEIFKSKDLSRVFKKREGNRFNAFNYVSEHSLKFAMDRYADLIRILPPDYSKEKFISEISKIKDEEKSNVYLGEITDSILKKDEGYRRTEEYKVLFKYSTFTIKDYILKINGDDKMISSICEELSDLSDDDILSSNLISDVLLKKNKYDEFNVIRWFIKNFGVKNIINFEKEYGNFLHKNLRALCDFLQSDITRLLIEYPNFYKRDNQSYTADEFYSIMRTLMIECPEIKLGLTSSEKFKQLNPDLFLDDSVAQEIKEKFYKKELTVDDFINNPNLIEEFRNTNIVCGFSNEFSWIFNLYNNINNPKISNYSRLKIISIYQSISNTMLKAAFKKCFKENWKNINIDNVDEVGMIIKNINDYNFIEEYLTTVKKNRDIIVNDFFKLISYTECHFIIELFNNNKISYMDAIKLISVCNNLNEIGLVKNILIKNDNVIDGNYIDLMFQVINRISLSNSSEMSRFKAELAAQILNSNNPIEFLNRIEDIFIKNNLPTVGKIYSCFEILYPDFQGFDFENSMISPVLKKSSTMNKKIIVFSDLIKSSFGSNNRTINAFLKNIESGSNLYESIKSGQIQFDLLSEIEKQELVVFAAHLATLYNNTMKAKKENETFILSDNVFADILELSKKLSPDGTLDYNLADRVIRMFCGFAGINTLEEAKNYVKIKVQGADKRNREAASHDMVLEKGDFIKGIGDVTYLNNILQNGSVSKEYLGSSAGSDATPLDTDMSMIMDSSGSISDKMDKTAAKDYGPIWFVLKNDERFTITRNDNETLDTKKDVSKMEVFFTGAIGADHYGIRTGFASSEINYIVMENYDPRVGLEIVMNGFYIPVANKEGKIIFTPKDYDNLREKMNGLSYYNMGKYVLDESIYTESEEIVDILASMKKNKMETEYKAKLIKNRINHALSELKLELKDKVDLNMGSAILFNTGSTGRFTNIPDDGDFDYTMQIDNDIYSSPDKMNELRNKLIQHLCRGETGIYDVVGNDIRELKTTIRDENGNEYPVEIDITFSHKTDKTEYASDVCVSDRLNNISSEEERDLVKANIIFAKKFLKSISAYKPARKFPDQGGLGGIGVENWILQNGGSFYRAAKSFVEVANKYSSFEEFKKMYSIPNFGINHMAIKNDFYPHDDYIENMNYVGYNKMKQALNEYINNYEYNQNINKSVVR